MHRTELICTNDVQGERYFIRSKKSTRFLWNKKIFYRFILKIKESLPNAYEIFWIDKLLSTSPLDISLLKNHHFFDRQEAESSWNQPSGIDNSTTLLPRPKGRAKHLKLGRHDTSRELFSSGKTGHFLKMKWVLTSLFITKSWGHVLPVPAGSYVYASILDLYTWAEQ